MNLIGHNKLNYIYDNNNMIFITLTSIKHHRIYLKLGAGVVVI